MCKIYSPSGKFAERAKKIDVHNLFNLVPVVRQAAGKVTVGLGSH